MDFFGKDQYDELLEVDQGPMVSIFIEGNRQDNKGKNHQLNFREQVKKATNLLEEHYETDDYEAVVERMQNWVDADDFWGSLTGGAALFFAPDFERAYRTATKLPTQTVVSDTFHTRPMLKLMLEPSRYWVLALGAKYTKLYEGTLDGLEQVNLYNIPTSVEEALDLEHPPHQNRNREQGAPNPGGSPTGIAGSTPAFHGYGRGKDAAPDHLRKYCSMVDDGLQDLLKEQSGPLILIGPERISGIYREVSDLDNLADEGLQQSVVHLEPAEIHKKAWPLAKEAVEGQLDDVMELWEREYDLKKAETDLAQIAKRTTMNQVRFLFIDEDSHVWGELDRENGNIDIDSEQTANPNAAHTTDLLDDLAEFVIQRGGKAFAIPTNRMPVDSPVAAILRGSGQAEGGERARMT